MGRSEYRTVGQFGVLYCRVVLGTLLSGVLYRVAGVGTLLYNGFGYFLFGGSEYFIVGRFWVLYCLGYFIVWRAWVPYCKAVPGILWCGGSGYLIVGRLWVPHGRAVLGTLL